MDNHSKELAQFTFGELYEKLGPDYERARTDFLSYLALQGASVENQLGKIEDKTDNSEVICNFRNILPASEWYIGWDSLRERAVLNARLVADSPDDLLAIQSSTIFVQNVSFSNKYPHEEGAYLIGMNAQTNQLLVVPANGVAETEKLESWRRDDKRVFQDNLEENKIYKLSSGNSGRSNKYGKKTRSALAKHLDAFSSLYNANPGEYAEKHFDSQRGIYTASSNDPQSFRIAIDCEAVSNMGKNYRFMEPLRYLSDKELADFNVIDHLSRLALVFDKGEDLLKLLEPKK